MNDTEDTSIRTQPANPWLARRVLCYAHQGGAREAPSNTMFALRRALTIGADALESGVVVCGGCVHPPHSAATPDARVDSFAGAVAMLESRNAWKRHRGGGGG